MRPPARTARPLAALALAGLALAVAGLPTSSLASAPAPERRGSRSARASNAPVSLEDFTAALEPLGEWLIHPTWGSAWRPKGVDPGWKPYYQGRWAHTAEGWYWVSAEPWAWATYHFGRWTLDPLVGWLWVPGKRWAPAWVAWREGRALVGWAPLAPTGKEHPATWTFVPREKLGEPVEKAAVSAIRVGPALQSTHRLVRVPSPAPSRAPVPAPAPREAGGAMASAGH